MLHDFQCGGRRSNIFLGQKKQWPRDRGKDQTIRTSGFHGACPRWGGGQKDWLFVFPSLSSCLGFLSPQHVGPWREGESTSEEQDELQRLAILPSFSSHPPVSWTSGQGCIWGLTSDTWTCRHCCFCALGWALDRQLCSVQGMVMFTLLRRLRKEPDMFYCSVTKMPNSCSLQQMCVIFLTLKHICVT